MTTGHAQRGVSSSPSPGPNNLHLEAGRLTPGRTDRRHQAGLLRHRPDRLRRQQCHRRLQPRRLRLLDRERQDHLSGERGDDRRTSPRDFPQPGAGQRPGIPLRHQCADAAHRGLDRCRPVNAAARHGPACARAVREAGASWRCTRRVRAELKSWTKGDDNSPVSEADIAVDDLLRARLPHGAPRRGWLSEESADDASWTSRKRWYGSSIRSTAPAAISPAATGRCQRGAGRGRPPACSRRCSRR